MGGLDHHITARVLLEELAAARPAASSPGSNELARHDRYPPAFERRKIVLVDISSAPSPGG